jgi:glutaredoxin
MKKIFLIILILVILMGGAWFFIKQKSSSTFTSQCRVKKITYYYLDNCPWCQKIESEGTLDKIEALGIKINKINAAIGPIFHKITGVPTFVINGKIYPGYKTFEELRNLLGCPK